MRITNWFLGALFFTALPLMAQDKVTPGHVGLPIDWSSRHVVHSQVVDGDLQRVAEKDPRILLSWFRRNQAMRAQAMRGALRPSPLRKLKPSIKTDWRFTLGAGTVAPGSYPAKYGFNIDTADCLKDYVIFALNVAGSATQPNLVGFNNLYIGPGNVGFCSANTTGGLPTVKWAYNVSAAGGPILTSPALSLDGTQVAFIESPAGKAVFHVLKLGTTGNNGVYTPLLLQYIAATPGVGNDASDTNYTYSTSATNSNSSPYIDYTNDVAYFADDNGTLYKTTCVFKCAQNGLTLGTAWSYSVAPGVKFTSPTVDLDQSRLLVGGSNGILYSVLLTSCPTTCPVTTLAVGNSSTNGGIIDAPIVDTTFQTVFVTAGRNGAALNAPAIAVEARESLGAGSNLATLAMGSNAYSIYNGALSDSYFTNALGNASAAGNAYFCGPFAGTQAGIYIQSFTAAAGGLSVANPPVMAASSSFNIPGNTAVPCSPITEFLNGTTDRLFFSQSNVQKCAGLNSVNDGCVWSYSVSGNSLVAGPNVIEHGTSGIIIDNATTDAQASSIYFTNTSTTGSYDPATNSPKCTYGATNTPAYCAVKLTQANLN